MNAARKRVVAVAWTVVSWLGMPGAAEQRLAGALRSAAEQGDRAAVRKLLAEGASVHATDPAFGATPLHWAARENHLDVAELLLAGGAAVNARAVSGQTPLHWAALYGNAETVTFLLSKGADARAVDRYGWTPADAARVSGRADMAAFVQASVRKANAASPPAQRELVVAQWRRTDPPSLWETDIPWYGKALAAGAMALSSGGGSGVGHVHVDISKAHGGHSGGRGGPRK